MSHHKLTFSVSHNWYHGEMFLSGITLHLAAKHPHSLRPFYLVYPRQASTMFSHHIARVPKNTPPEAVTEECFCIAVWAWARTRNVVIGCKEGSRMSVKVTDVTLRYSRIRVKICSNFVLVTPLILNFGWVRKLSLSK